MSDNRKCGVCRQALKYLAERTKNKHLNIWVCPTCDKPMHQADHLVWRTD